VRCYDTLATIIFMGRQHQKFCFLFYLFLLTDVKMNIRKRKEHEKNTEKEKEQKRRKKERTRDRFRLGLVSTIRQSLGRLEIYLKLSNLLSTLDLRIFKKEHEHRSANVDGKTSIYYFLRQCATTSSLMET